MNNQPVNTRSEAKNLNLEIALVKIARALYEFVSSQESSQAIISVDRLMAELQSRVNNYVNAVGGLHPDLGLELREWATFKAELLAPDHDQQVQTGKSGLTPESVAFYGSVTEAIIVGLEDSLSF